MRPCLKYAEPGVKTIMKSDGRTMLLERVFTIRPVLSLNIFSRSVKSIISSLLCLKKSIATCLNPKSRMPKTQLKRWLHLSKLLFRLKAKKSIGGYILLFTIVFLIFLKHFKKSFTCNYAIYCSYFNFRINCQHVNPHEAVDL